MVRARDFDYEREGKHYGTRTSQTIINEVTYAVMMSDEIDSRRCMKDPIIGRLFAPKPASLVAGTTAPDEEDEKHGKRGSIASVNVEKGYSFIRPDGGGDNLFFHVSSLSGCEIADINQGDAVLFQVAQTDRGPNAVNVCLRT